MYFLSTDPLVEKFRTGTFDDSAVFPYFMGYVLLTGSPASATIAKLSSGWDLLWLAVSLTIAIFGILYLRKKNGGDFSDQFLAKYFCFTWIVSWQMVLAVFPLFIAFQIVIAIVGQKPPGELSFIIGGIVIQIVYFNLLGALIAQSRRQKNAPVEPGAEPDHLRGTVL